MRLEEAVGLVPRRPSASVERSFCHRVRASTAMRWPPTTTIVAARACAGVAPAHIDDRPPCTRCEPARFFSYRRDGKDGGMHMAFIGVV